MRRRRAAPVRTVRLAVVLEPSPPPGPSPGVGSSLTGERAGRTRRPPRLAWGLLLVLAGLLCWILYAIAARSENQPYRPHGDPPTTVRLTGGHTYWLAVPGGVETVRDRGADPAGLDCTATSAGPGSSAEALDVAEAVSKDNSDTKFTDRIGSFVAARSGTFRVTCAQIGRVYVDSDDSPFDWSGLWLVLASAALAAGLPLTFSGLRRPRETLAA
jgi:hypothetical protein